MQLYIMAFLVFKAGTHYPYVRAVRTARTEKSIACNAFLPVWPVRTGGVYGTPVYVARNVISI